MVLDESVGADALMVREGIPDVSGLRGKAIGVDVRSAGAYLLANALEEAGMTMKDVELVQLIHSEMQVAVQAGRVDAVVVAGQSGAIGSRPATTATSRSRSPGWRGFG